AWRQDTLRRTRDHVDSIEVLEEPPEGAAAPGTDELAFSVWSQTALAGAGVASAVELQDRSGAMVSRFALNLPPVPAQRGLPGDDGWKVTRERFTVASAERHVLHARRRLVYHGEVHGAVHVYLGDDAWDLPFLPVRDPYAVLYRSPPAAPSRESGVD